MKLMNIMLAIAVALSGCGTRDYKDRPEEKRKDESNSAQPASTNNQRSDRKGVPSLFQSYAKEGFIWSSLKEQPWAESLKCTVRDSDEVDYWNVWAYQMFGGAVLGVIYKAAGGYWYGRPSNEPDSTRAIPAGSPVRSDWAWDRIYLDSKRFWQGVVRGAAATTLCANILGPGYLLPTNGVIGSDFRAVSTSLALGVAAAIAVKPYMNYFMRGAFNKGEVEGAPTSSRTAEVVRALSERFSFPGKKNFVARTILPNVTVIMIGGGVGLLINHTLQHPNGNVSAEEKSCWNKSPIPTNGATK